MCSQTAECRTMSYTAWVYSLAALDDSTPKCVSLKLTNNKLHIRFIKSINFVGFRVAIFLLRGFTWVIIPILNSLIPVQQTRNCETSHNLKYIETLYNFEKYIITCKNSKGFQFLYWHEGFGQFSNNFVKMIFQKRICLAHKVLQLIHPTNFHDTQVKIQ